MSERPKPAFIGVIKPFEEIAPPALLIVKYKGSSEWASGKDKLQDELRGYLETLSNLSGHDTVYGVGGIGIHWMAYKMDKGGQPALMLDWQDDITSDKSYE